MDADHPQRGSFLHADSHLSPTMPFIVGIRPHRVGGVCLKLEDEPIPSRFGPKFLIHNYGHGGAGITLSFGCASVVADHVQALMRDMRRSRMRPSIAVIGSGVIGLTVAAELRRRWRRMPIAIYAKQLDVRKTTSFMAGGQFGPSGIGHFRICYARDEVQWAAALDRMTSALAGASRYGG